MAEQEADRRRDWQSTIEEYEKRLEGAGLGDVVRAIREALVPVTPLAAHLLWFVQPALGLFGHYELAGELAELLSDAGEASEHTG